MGQLEQQELAFVSQSGTIQVVSYFLQLDKDFINSFWWDNKLHLKIYNVDSTFYIVIVGWLTIDSRYMSMAISLRQRTPGGGWLVVTRARRLFF